MRWHRTIVQALAATLALLWCTPASAFCRTMTCKTDCSIGADECPVGTPIRWESSCVGVSIDSRGSSLLDRPEIDRALRDAMAAWNNADCGGGRHPSVKLLQLEDVACSHNDYVKGAPNANVLHFRDESWEGAQSQVTIALTNVSFEKSSGEILDADIAMNMANKRISLNGHVNGAFDLRVVLTHELGHLLGIAHSQDPDATMSFSVETADTSPRVLSADDVAAICAIYPPDDARTCDPEPRGGLGGCEELVEPRARCSTSDGAPATGSATPCVVVAGLALSIAWRRRRRGRLART